MAAEERAAARTRMQLSKAQRELQLAQDGRANALADLQSIRAETSGIQHASQLARQVDKAW